MFQIITLKVVHNFGKSHLLCIAATDTAYEVNCVIYTIISSPDICMHNGYNEISLDAEFCITS